MAFDHELKAQRAVKHLQDLQRGSRAWEEDDNYSVRFKYDPDATLTGEPPDSEVSSTTFLGETSFMPGQDETPIPDAVFGKGLIEAFATVENKPLDSLRPILGDALHNLRSALDTLAYALAAAFTKPLPQEIARSSEFPIFGDVDGHGNTGVGSEMFNERKNSGEPARGSGLYKIRGWHPDAQAIVEGLQPYHVGDGFTSHPLWVLHELDRVSKHRLLHTAVATSRSTIWNWEAFRNVRGIGPGIIQTLRGPVETDTPIGRIYGVHVVDPEAEVHVEIHPSLSVTFDGSTAPFLAGSPISAKMWLLHEEVWWGAIQTLSPFL